MLSSGAPSAPNAFGAPGAVMPRLCPTCGVHYPAEFKVCPRDTTALIDTPREKEAEHDDLVGTMLADTYKVVRVVGEGGMGRVYEAQHKRLPTKRFAIKMLHPEFARQPEVIQRFQREAEAAASIRSPNVVDVYDVDKTADGRPYMVGEFLEGEEFAEYLHRVGRLPAGAAVRIVRQICKALAAAHDKGVVHRDMKPENVYLTGDLSVPVAKVIDFGISKIRDEPGSGPALTKTGMIMGTPAYMSPEQARGERVDHRADIYAVGAILYCALTGKRPFDRGDPTATLTAVLVEDPPRPRSLEPSIPEALELVIQRAMAKSPADRPQTMAELDAELAPFDPGDVLPTELGSGRTGLAIANPTTATSLSRQTREISLARPTIVLLSALGIFWALAGVVTLVAALVRLMRGGGVTSNLTGVEAVLLFLGATFALLTPAGLFVRYLQRVWDNSLKAMNVADNLRRIVLVGLAAYGFGSLLVRFLEAIVLRRAAGVAWPVWDLLMFVIAAAAAVGAHMLVTGEQKGRR